MARKHSYKDLFMGAIVGGTLALLFGTKGGKQVQKKVRNTVNKLDLRHNLPKMATLRTFKNKIQSKLKAAIKNTVAYSKKAKSTSARHASAKRKHHS